MYVHNNLDNNLMAVFYKNTCFCTQKNLGIFKKTILFFVLVDIYAKLSITNK